ncbi:phospholipase D family protein [Bacillus horti]|uniref:phospholipase D family protein n=1 Tax=Caldalkalibacillus horti TaxID=77523 RepID=UPI0027D8C2CA|nr:phospholipase D family protein [Bacillus horti]
MKGLKKDGKLKGLQRIKLISWKMWALLFALIYCIVMIYGVYKPFPTGLSYKSETYYTDHVEFLADLTYTTEQGQVIMEQQIFERALAMIDAAQDFVLVDMFLFNDIYDKEEEYPELSYAFTEALIRKKQSHPELEIIFITDPLNTTYYSHTSPHLERMQQNDIETIITSLTPLRDSNPIFSSVWRTYLQWFGQGGFGWLPNPSGSSGPNVTARSYLKLFNVKANHRKVIVTEQEALITSANAHDASSYHSNIAFVVQGEIIRDIVRTEEAVIRYSTDSMYQELMLPLMTDGVAVQDDLSDQGIIELQLITEGKIYEAILTHLQQTDQGDRIWMGMFYLAEREIVKELLAAADRGVEVHLILDQNVEAFGHEKIGLPNKPVAAGLVQQSEGDIQVRWYETNGEQYHTKLMLIEEEDRGVIIGGSANFTRRNLKDLNLETNLLIQAPRQEQIVQEVAAYFKRLWHNEGGLYTAPYEEYKDESWYLRFIYHFQKLTNLSTY